MLILFSTQSDLSRCKTWKKQKNLVTVRDPSGSDRPADHCESSPIARIRVGGLRGANPTRLDPKDPRMTREYLIHLFINYLIS